MRDMYTAKGDGYFNLAKVELQLQYQLAVRKNVVPDGPTLMEQAKAIAQRLGIKKSSAHWSG